MALELFRIFCILESNKDDPERAFLVKIAKTETVYDLKEAIKAKVSSLAKYDADSIVLNRVNILSDGDYEENIKNVTQTRLNTMQELGAIFPTGPQKDMLHIIVKTLIERESTALSAP
jgi:Crinkler effector protein N-terminal domain